MWARDSDGIEFSQTDDEVSLRVACETSIKGRDVKVSLNGGDKLEVRVRDKVALEGVLFSKVKDPVWFIDQDGGFVEIALSKQIAGTQFPQVLAKKGEIRRPHNQMPPELDVSNWVYVTAFLIFLVILYFLYTRGWLPPPFNK